MLHLITAVSALLISATVSLSDQKKEHEAEFFAGVTLLQQQADIKPEEKARKFRELEAMTGISAAEAETILLEYREKPVEWQKIYSQMIKLLNETNVGFQKSDSLRAPTKDTGKRTAPAGTPKSLPPQKNKR